MVIISTSATEVSIQAVSPEFGVHFSWTLASQAGGGGSAAAAVVAWAAGAAGGAWANDTSTVTVLKKAASRSPQASPNSPTPRNFLNAMVIRFCLYSLAGSEGRNVSLAGANANGL